MNDVLLKMFYHNYMFVDTNKCNNNTHKCTHGEICVSTPKGFKCLPRSTMSIAPENLIKYPKKQNCNIGYAYDVYSKTCKGIFDNSLYEINTKKEL